MTVIETSSRPFVPGSTGWTARNLDELAVEREWTCNRYEIVEGVLATLPVTSFREGEVLTNLVCALRTYCGVVGERGGFACHVGVVIDDHRVVRPDAVFLDRKAKRRQADAVTVAGRPDPRRTHVLIPPTLVVESISPGHEAHDRRTKRRWYAEFGVPHYWLLDTFDQSLECLTLAGADYQRDAAGRGNEVVRPASFPGLAVPLEEVWET